MKLFIFSVILLCSAIAHELKCYTCSSTKSWEDCKSTQSKKTCPEGQERCFKVSTEYNGTKSYSKDCLDEASCDDKDTYLQDCKAAQNSTCILTCCSSELCNSGAEHVFGVFLLVPCVVQGFLF
ncbi:PREDICTED: ly6/PLAUR domain-containing protein 1-like [Acropora digitifera]|uniref:ly6/PLAUR domain-containing protein 1-like n=1 Tax=Acropora digitifera TaxID=70779 RepID=UPI00077A00DD|nr:PREDICTED: ly6/PLAUR domain-containing protein 1-like [Acropora digitifera]